MHNEQRNFELRTWATNEGQQNFLFVYYCSLEFDFIFHINNWKSTYHKSTNSSTIGFMIRSHPHRLWSCHPKHGASLKQSFYMHYSEKWVKSQSWIQTSSFAYIQSQRPQYIISIHESVQITAKAPTHLLIHIHTPVIRWCWDCRSTYHPLGIAFWLSTSDI